MADCDKKYLRKNICAVCGKEFYSSGNNKYCSKECRDKNTDNLYINTKELKIKTSMNEYAMKMNSIII